MLSKFPDFESIVDYLRDIPLSPPVVASATTSSSNEATTTVERTKKQRKTKKRSPAVDTNRSTSVTSGYETNSEVLVLPEGRVRYGPITVHPRQQPSKTLFTGRRSKYEVLSGDDEEKRRDRRERNRVAATKCREKRENVLLRLENEYLKQLKTNEELTKQVEILSKRKNHLESIVSNHFNECPQLNNIPLVTEPSMIFGDTGFLSLINDTAPAPPLPSLQQAISYSDEEDFNRIIDSTTVLTNSAYNTDDSNSNLIPEPSILQHLTLKTSSLERLVNSFQSPTISMETINNHSMLFNSAVGSSSCAKQHSHSSEDDSLPSTHTNHFVC